MLSDLSICRALIARKTPIILAEGGQTLLNPCIRCDVYSQSRHSSRQQGSMRGVFSVSKRGENITSEKMVVGKAGTSRSVLLTGRRDTHMFMGKAMPMRSKSCWTGGLPKRKTSTALPAIQSTGIFFATGLPCPAFI